MNTQNYLVISNGAFLVPLVLAVSFKVWWYAVVLAISLSWSWLYHASQERRHAHIDVFCALALMAANFVLLFDGSWQPAWYAGVAVVAAVLALTVYARQRVQYAFRHSMFHVVSAVVCAFCLLVYYF